MMTTSIIKISNGKIMTPYRIISHGTVLITGSKIVAVTENDVDVDDGTAIDAGGHYIALGFIDIHVHGGGGYDFMDGSEEAFLTVTETYARYGTTAIFPTTLNAEIGALMRTLGIYEKVNTENKGRATLMGIHFEGPYFATNQHGAQDARFIHPPDKAEYEKILAFSTSSPPTCRYFPPGDASIASS